MRVCGRSRRQSRGLGVQSVQIRRVSRSLPRLLPSLLGSAMAGALMGAVAVPLQAQQPAAVPQNAATAKTKVPLKYDVSRIGNRGIGGGVNFYSLQKKEMLGKELSDEFEHNAHLVSDPVITEHINRLGQKLVRNSDAKVPFTIKVIDDDEVNAFTLPGGFFYVNTGLIRAADNEAELAGVMAHEIAHVAARHATKSQTKAEIWNLATIPLILAGEPAGYAVGQTAGVLAPISFLKFSRNAEREADLLGMEYEYATGYDPRALVDFPERLEAGERERRSFVARAFATHPMTGSRVKAAQKEIVDYLPAREQYIVTTSEFEAIKTRLEQLQNRQHVDLGNKRPTLLQRGTRSEDTKNESGTDDNARPTLRRAENKD